MTISHASDQATEGAAMPHPGRNPVDTGLPDAVSAFLEEASELDDLLSRLPEEDLAKQTPFSNWRVEDVVRHFIALERMAYLAIVDEAAFALSRDELIEWTSTPTPDEPAINPNFSRLRRLHAHKLGDIPRARLIGAWRESREMLASAAANTGDRKIAWFGPPMPLSRLFVSRQMEIWAYGQDVFDTFRIHRINGRRLCNVVDFGIRTRGFAFAVNGIPLPEAPHIALLAPSGHVWHWGDPLSPERISGAAEEFALVVTQRRNIADTGLEVTGEGAAQWMRIAQTIAGAPVTPPAPGERAWEASGEGNAPALPHAATVPALVHHLSRRFGSLPQIVDSMGAA
ncbi:MAG: maleylpyruvate isomerase family mycothiol-dependent enzyme, partial [Novosphingobium sp.]|nr:maleylpyruvate isomerase family mycothiol-dependent enzyme [Novosphingobium sp.]